MFFAFAELKPFEKRLRGRLVTSVRPRGKAILTSFEGGWHVYSHNQLYGRWFVRRRGELPETQRSLRFAVYNEDWSALLYSASEIDVLDELGVREHPFLSRLGPDVLESGLSPARIASRFRQRVFRNRRLGSLLLDQTFLAGLGNYLRSEILFDAGLHPELRPSELGREELLALSRSCRRLTLRSYRTGGITNEADRVKRLKAQGKNRSSYRFTVFGRAGQTCYRCRGRIAKMNVGGRRLYLCPRCQKL